MEKYKYSDRPQMLEKYIYIIGKATDGGKI
jgi:hypothetical protein